MRWKWHPSCSVAPSGVAGPRCWRSGSHKGRGYARWGTSLARHARLVEAASARAGPHARALVLSSQARRYLALQYRSYPTEFMGCMIGEISGNAVLVRRIAPADVEPAQSTATHVVPKQTCEDAGWMGTVGMINSHPTGERCWYYFPGTPVANSDVMSFARQPYAVDAIMCGDRVVWISRDMVEQQVT